MGKIFPVKKQRGSRYQKFLLLLCWLKIIPVSTEKGSGAHKFRILSIPTLMSTLWFWITLSYWIFFEMTVEFKSGKNESITQGAQMTNNMSNTSVQFTGLDLYIYYGFVAGLLLLILLLPVTMGHFFALNGATMLKNKFCWPKHGWMLVVSLLVYLVTEITTIALLLMQLKTMGMTTASLVHRGFSSQLMNVTAGIFQFVVLLLASARQTAFIQSVKMYASDRNKIKSVGIFYDIMETLEAIRTGVEPLNALEFCVHVPIILCFSYVGLYKQLC
jgi:hypothetical protein